MWIGLNPNLWLISDTHFGHDNIVRFCNRPENHDSLMQWNWAMAVGEDEPILHLGDIMYRGDRTWALKLLGDLPGKKYRIKGNHDKQTNLWYQRAGFTDVGSLLGEFDEDGRMIQNYGFYWQNGGQRVLFSHYPDIWRKDWDLNIHGHIHNNAYPAKLSNIDRYRNVSVEVIDFTPIRLKDIL